MTERALADALPIGPTGRVILVARTVAGLARPGL